MPTGPGVLGLRWHGVITLANGVEEDVSVTVNVPDWMATGTVWGIVHDLFEQLAEQKWRYGPVIQSLPDENPYQVIEGGFDSPTRDLT